MPLASILEGTRTILHSIRGGRGIRGRLAALGLVPGAEITVLRNSGRGPFLIAVKETRICIGRGIAMNIEVE